MSVGSLRACGALHFFLAIFFFAPPPPAFFFFFVCFFGMLTLPTSFPFSHLRKENASFSQLFLCLSRACLGKMIVLP